MDKLTHKRTWPIAIGLAAVSSAFWLNTKVNAYTVSFQGEMTIDFGEVNIPPPINIGQQMLSIDETIDLPFTREEILLSLADGDSSIPIEPFLSGLFPQELEIDGQSIRLNSILINAFIGSGSASAADGLLTNFDFQYIASDPVLGVPVVEITNFNPNLSQCVDIKCQYQVTSSNLSASFDATLIPSPNIADSSTAENDFIITLIEAPVTASLSATPVPESMAWFVVPSVFGSLMLSRFFRQ